MVARASAQHGCGASAVAGTPGNEFPGYKTAPVETGYRIDTAAGPVDGASIAWIGDARIIHPMDTHALLQSHRNDILSIAARHGAHNVRVFGSVARGEARPDSDVDILVDMEPGRSLLDLGGFLVELQTLLGVEVDVVTEKGLRPRVRAQVMQEAVSL